MADDRTEPEPDASRRRRHRKPSVGVAAAGVIPVKPPRFSTRHSVFLAAFTIVIVGCALDDVRGNPAAYPSFSLVGAPSRAVTYEYAISAFDMRTISGRVSSNERALVVEVPPGRSRRVEFKAIDDVYSGAASVDLLPGSRTSVALRLYPGPIFPDALGNRIVQFRDIGGAGVRSAGAGEAGVDDLVPVDAAYDSSGRLWVASNPEGGGDGGEAEIFRITTLDGRSPDILTVAVENGIEPTAITAGPSSGRVFFASLTEGALVSELTESRGEQVPNEVANISSLLGRDGYQGLVVGGMSVDEAGILFLLAYEDFSGGRVVVVAIDPDRGAIVAGPVEIPNARVPAYSNGAPGLRPVGDVLARGGELFVVVSAVDPGAPVVFRYDTRLGPRTEWGVLSDRDRPGSFRGPRRFLAARTHEQLLVIDQSDSEDDQSVTGRIVAFGFGTTEGWGVYEQRGGLQLFDTRLAPR